MIDQIINTADVQTVLLIGLLIAAFIVAFKVLKMIMQTVTVSLLSAAFYVGLVYLFSYPLSVDRLLLFAFMGATLYMGFSFLISAYSIAARVLEIPYRIVKYILIVPWTIGKKGFQTLEAKARERDMKKQAQREKQENGEEVKETVLKKLDEQDEE